MIDSKSHRAVGVPVPRDTVGLQIAVPGGIAEGPAVLTIEDGGASRTVAVYASPLPEVPGGVVALPEPRYKELGLGDDDVRWSLCPRPAVQASRLVLELPAERPVATVAREIAGGGLAGTLLPPGAAAEDHWLNIAGFHYRVRDVEAAAPGADNRDALLRVGRDTAVELYASGVRAGVDMVILADISLSMNAEDIPVPRESTLAQRARNGRIKRIDALREALLDLLHVRMQVSGRVSRVALLAFNSMTFPKFPADGGMVELDANSPRRIVDDFTRAVRQLEPRGATRIEIALHAAAELLYRHGHPHNERLIVLVSDGATWTPGKDSDTGRVREAIKEPVSLMEHLHRDMKVRLHAIGVSTPELFRRHFRDDPTLTPDHRLLKQLVKVGGGDPAQIGGLDVLVRYFSAAGGGLTHRVPGPLAAAPPLRLAPGAPQVLRRAVRRGGRRATSAGALMDRIAKVTGDFEEATHRALPAPLYRHRHHVANTMVTLHQASTGEAGADGADGADGLLQEIAIALSRLRLTSPEAQRHQCLGTWSALVRRLSRPVTENPPNLSVLAAECRSTDTSPQALVVAALERLIDGLEELVRGLNTLPPRQPSGRPLDAEHGQAVPAHRGRIRESDRTEVPGAAAFEMKG